MTTDDLNSAAEPEAVTPRRRPYQPPRIKDSAGFETLALQCGKVEGDGDCIFGGVEAS